MTIAQQFAAKASVAFVAAAMIISLMAPAAQAQSADELQAMINTLMAQIAALQGQVGQGASGVASGVCPYTWTRDLSQGSTGPDVMKLQQFLNADADTRVAASGAGSVGAETEYFGPATAAAVSKMQVKYRAEVLSPAGLVNPTGFFGPSSRAKANSVCVAAPVVVPDDVDDEDVVDDEDTTDDKDVVELQGEANLDTVEIDNPSDTTIDEGERDVEIAEITIEFENGDAELNRLDFQVTNSVTFGTLGDDPWDVFENLSLWIDGEKIADERSDDKNDWLDDNDGTFRFSNLNMVFEEDVQYKFIIAADIANGLDQQELGNWKVFLDRIRFFDADGVSTDEPTFDDLGGADSAEFTIQKEGQDEELTFRLSGNNPDGQTIVVDDKSTTNDITILRYEIEADDADIDIDTLVIRIDTPGEQVEDVLNDIEIMIDGQRISDEGTTNSLAQIGTRSYVYQAGDAGAAVPNTDGQTLPNGLATGEAIWYVFDVDDDVTINDNQSVDVEVNVDFRQQTGNYTNGTTIQARVTTLERNLTRAEGRDDLRASDGSFSGSAIDEPHTLVAQGLAFNLVEITSKVVTGAGDAPKDTVEFTAVVDVTAVEETFYIDDVGSAFVATVFEDATTTLSASTSVTKTISASGANKQGDRFRIDNGDSERMTFKVTVFPNGQNPGGQYRVQFDSLTFYDESIGGNVDNQIFVPTSNYRSDDETVVN